MARTQAGKVNWSATEGWEVHTEAGTRRGRRAAAGAGDPFVAGLTATHRWEVEETLTATPKVRRGEAAAAPLTLDVEGGPDDVFVVMTRYASGAIRFHVPTESPRRGARRGATKVYRFQIPVPPAPIEEAPGRRGIISRAIKAVVLKIAGKVVDFALAKLALLWESAAWKLKGRREGWLSVTADGLLGEKGLPPADLSTLSTSGRNLLLIHGTFSNTQAAFRGLATTPGGNGKTFFEECARSTRTASTVSTTSQSVARPRTTCACCWRPCRAAPRRSM